MEPKRLYRSTRNAMLGGIAGGIAEYFNIDPTLVRLIFIVLVPASGFVPAILVYMILWFVVPRNPM